MQTLLIAGNPLESYTLQRKYEIQLNVNVKKIYELGNQQPRLEQSKVHRLVTMT